MRLEADCFLLDLVYRYVLMGGGIDPGTEGKLQSESSTVSLTRLCVLFTLLA